VVSNFISPTATMEKHSCFSGLKTEREVLHTLGTTMHRHLPLVLFDRSTPSLRQSGYFPVQLGHLVSVTTIYPGFLVIHCRVVLHNVELSTVLHASLALNGLGAYFYSCRIEYAFRRKLS
jgi:hypothetical protein